MTANWVEVRSMDAQTDTIWSVLPLPDSKNDGVKGVLIPGDNGKVVDLWILTKAGTDMERVSSFESHHTRAIRSMAINPQGFLATASFDSTVGIHRFDSTIDIHSPDAFQFVCALDGHENEVKSVAWSSNGMLLASCGRDKTVWIWQLDGTDFDCIAVLQEHTQDVKCVCWHPRDELLLSASYDNSIRVWKEDEEDWYCSQELSSHQSTVWSISFSGDGSSFASGSDDLSVIVWGINSDGKYEAQYHVKDVHQLPIYCIRWNTVSDLIATSSGDNSITILNRKGTVMTRIDGAHANDVNSVAWIAGSSNMLLSADDCGKVKLWRIEC